MASIKRLTLHNLEFVVTFIALLLNERRVVFLMDSSCTFQL